MNHYLVRNDQPALMSPKELEAAIVLNLPQIDHHNEVVEEVGGDAIRIRLPFQPEFVSKLAGKTEASKFSQVR